MELFSIQFVSYLSENVLPQLFLWIRHQQNSFLAAVNDLEGRQLGVVLNEQVTSSSNDGKIFSASDVMPTEGSEYPLLASGDGDVLTKHTQHNNEQRQQYRQGVVRKKSQNSDYPFTDKIKFLVVAALCSKVACQTAVKEMIRFATLNRR